MRDHVSPQTAYAQGRELAETLLDDAPSSEEPDARRQHLTALLERWEAGCRTLESHALLECARGCTPCCHYPVGLTVRELDLLWPHVRERLARPVVGGRLRDAVERAWAAGRGEDWAARAAARRPCPLLDETGACQVYAARPLGCRGWTSFSRAQCERSVTHREPIPFESVRYFGALGIAGALEAGPPHPGERYELVAALHAMLRLQGPEPVTLAELRARLHAGGLHPLPA